MTDMPQLDRPGEDATEMRGMASATLIGRIFRRAKRMMLPRRIPAIVHEVRQKALTYLEPHALTDLYDVVRALETRNVEGAIVEAGCALGGSAIVITAAKRDARPFYVYDVFGTIPPPSEKDGADVHERYSIISSGKSTGIGGEIYYGYVDNLLGAVHENFRSCGEPVEENNVRLVPGLFQDTIQLSEPVSFAHIDGDWYESVMTCLERIEPLLIPGGVLVIDDYDHWSGCRKAVDEYFRDKKSQYRFVRRLRLHIVRRGR
jgi:hypothetical protein